MSMAAGEITHGFVRVRGTELVYPETVIRGTRAGGHVTVSAGDHSREYVGIEAAKRLSLSIRPEDLRGELHIIHAVNYSGFIKRSADICPEDALNLNRVFPGDENGSSTLRLAAFLESEVIRNTDCIIDLHSFQYFSIFSLIQLLYRFR